MGGNYNTVLLQFKGVVRLTEEKIKTLYDVESLQCDGEPPVLRRLLYHKLKNAASFAFTDPTINRLPDDNKLHWRQFSGSPTMLDKYFIEDLQHALMQVLKARGYKLPNEVIQFAINTKLQELYQNIDNRLEAIRGMGTESPDSVEIKKLISSCEEAAAPLLANKKQNIELSYDKCLAAWLKNMEEGDDISPDIPLQQRFNKILEILNDYPLYLLDLRGRELPLEVQTLFRSADTRNIKLVLSPYQLELYLPQEQLEGRKFFAAVKRGDIPEVKKFCNRGIVNYVDPERRTALMVACMANQVAVVELLLRHGANVHIKTTSGNTIIEGLSRLRDNSPERKRIVELLIKASADITALHAATAFGDLAGMNRVYPAGLINQKVEGYAPIHIAAIHDHLPNLKWLCDNGAHVNLVDDYGLFPLDLACENESCAAIQFLTEKDTVCNVKKAIDAMIPKHLALAGKLIDKHGCNVEQMRMLKAALKDILILRLVRKEGFLPGIPPEATVKIIHFISGSFISLQEGETLINKVVSTTMAILDCFARKVELPQEDKKRCILC